MKTTAATRIAAAIQRRYGETVDVAEDLPGRDALAAMNERSVCRRYRADPVPAALLRLLCATALASPTKSDLQQASIVRVERYGWTEDKARQYSEPQRADFGAFVRRKRYRLD